MNRTIKEATVNASTTRATSSYGGTSPISWLRIILPAGLRRSAALQPTNTSPKSGLQNQTGTSLTRSVKCVTAHGG
jgi:hypothetical protein